MEYFIGKNNVLYVKGVFDEGFTSISKHETREEAEQTFVEFEKLVKKLEEMFPNKPC
jgi:hypothetical protein